jgi:hypothetical protein
MINPHKKNQLLFLLIVSMSVIPFLIAWYLSNNPNLLNPSTNNGQLIIPPITTENTDFTGFDNFSASNLGELKGHWLITNIITGTDCTESCLEAILKTKQLRLMLNKELARTRRVVLLFNAPDSNNAAQWWLKDSLLGKLREHDMPLFTSLLKPSNKLDESLITKIIGSDDREFALQSDLIRLIPNNELIKKINASHQGGISDGMLLLIDPLGNIMMQYSAGFDTYKVKNDLMHLLKVSQIG